MPQETFYEGTLSVAPEDDPHPHFQIDYRDEDADPRCFICNARRSIQVQIQGKWIEGHVELGGYQNDRGKWLWHLETGEGDIILYTGMKARFRDRYL